jgi:hypothetical protein
MAYNPNLKGLELTLTSANQSYDRTLKRSAKSGSAFAEVSTRNEMYSAL